MVKEHEDMITDFDDATVQTLNERQLNLVWPFTHPYTCPDRGESPHGEDGNDKGVLVATSDGWVCPYCGYTQSWAHAFSVASFDEGLSSAPQAIRDLMQTIMDDAKGLAAQIIEKYSKLAVDIEFNNLCPAENKDRRLNAVRTMIGCLQRFRLAQYGIETRPGKTRGVSADWVSLEDRWPVEGEGEVFEVVCELDILPGLKAGDSYDALNGGACRATGQTYSFLREQERS